MTALPLQIEVVSHVLGSLSHCSHCQIFIDEVGVGGQVREADLAAYPQEFMDDWQRLSDWVIELTGKFPGQITIKITDAQSPRALWQALRYGIRRYPTFVVEGERYQGWEAEPDVMTRLNQLLAKQSQPTKAK